MLETVLHSLMHVCVCIYTCICIYIFVERKWERRVWKQGRRCRRFEEWRNFLFLFFFFFFLLMDNPFMRFMRFLLPLLASVSDGSRVMSLFFFLDLCTLHFSLKFVENFVTLASWFFCFHLKIMRNVFLVLCLNAFFSWEITREFVFEEINSGPRWNVQIFIVWMKNKDKLLSNYLLYGQKLEKVWN